MKMPREVFSSAGHFSLWWACKYGIKYCIFVTVTNNHNNEAMNITATQLAALNKNLEEVTRTTTKICEGATVAFLGAEDDKMRFAVNAPNNGFSQSELDHFTAFTRWGITKSTNRAILAWAYIM